MEEVPITVHPNTSDLETVWDELKDDQIHEKVTPLDPSTPVTEDNIRFVCISDTHSKMEESQTFIMPPGDVLIHAGDFTLQGFPRYVVAFNNYLGQLPHTVKVVICGNHENTFDDELVKNRRTMLKREHDISERHFEEVLKLHHVRHAKELLTNCIYLQDEALKICGLKLYGTPWQPNYKGGGFKLKRGQDILDKWNLIDTDTDILITHGPPMGRGDLCSQDYRTGCVELLSTVQKRVKPKYHIFGHIHEGYGISSDGITTYINASTCTESYRPNNPPVVFDMRIPEGHTKTELFKVKKSKKHK